MILDWFMLEPLIYFPLCSTGHISTSNKSNTEEERERKDRQSRREEGQNWSRSFEGEPLVVCGGVAHGDESAAHLES